MSSTFSRVFPCKLSLSLLILQSVCSSVAKLDIDEVTDVYNNSLFGDNDLWSSLYDRCGTRSSYSCVQDSVFGFLDRTLESDVFESDAVSFRQNENNYTDLCRRVKKDDPGDYNDRAARRLSAVDDEEFQDFVNRVEEVERLDGETLRTGRNLNGSKEPPESVEESDNSTRSIRDVTDILYDRGLKYLMTHDVDLSLPSAVFGGGKVRVSPRGFDDDGGVLVKLNVVPDPPQEGRFFFKQLQKIFKKKLMTSMLAAVLILKLLKLKAMFFLPLLLGVGTAKKLLLKVLLFLFPALAHLFKLCSYYHHKHAKYHHHHHQIAHHHHHIPVPVYTPVHSAPGELPAPYPASYDSSGPGVYSHSRTESPGSLADLAAWGLGEYPASWDSPATDLPRYSYPTRSAQLTAATQQYGAQADLKRLYAAPTKTAPQYTAALANRFQALTPRPAAAPVSTAYDPFYSPMLQRLEAVFVHLGVQEEGCRERLVCSMYKNPARFSPHSNLVSAELSRDPSELQKPTTANSAVVRFYRYIQAARDGQELKDCLRIYAACAISTE